MKKILDSPHPYAFATILCWAPTFVMSHMAGPYLTPAELGCLRYMLAAVILSVILFVRRYKLPDWKDLPYFAFSAVCGFSLYMIIFNRGTSTVTAATSSVIIAMTPVITGVMASFMFKERLNRLQWLAMGIQFAGVLILVLVGNSFSFNTGALWLLLCAFMLAFYNTIQRRYSKKYPPFLVSAVTIILGGLELVWALPSGIRQFQAAPPKIRFFVIFMGIFASAIAYVTWTIAISKAEKTSEATNYMFITPFFAALLGFLLNNEVPSVSTIIGGLLVLAGAVLFNKSK